MLGKRLISLLKRSTSSKISSSVKQAEDGNSSSWMVRKGINYLLITIAGGLSLSAADDIAIYYGCSSKAFEEASRNLTLVEAIGEPIKIGPWYKGKLSLTDKRKLVLCTFPVSGQRGYGTLQAKADRNKGATWLPFLNARDWKIKFIEAELDVYRDGGEPPQTVHMTIIDHGSPPHEYEFVSDSV